MTTPRLLPIALLIATGSACGWFAGSGTSDVYVDPTEVDLAPKCRPKGLDDRGTPPWSVGDTTPSGWKVTEVDVEHEEYVRIGFDKDGTATKLEIAFNADGAGDWSTDKYRLMPAPGEEPPQELLLEAIATLRAASAAETGPPFVRRTEGTQDPYEGLPPCE